MVFLLECSFSYFAAAMSLSTCLNSMLYITAGSKEMHTHQTAVASKHTSEQPQVSNRKHGHTFIRLTVNNCWSIYMLPVAKDLKGRPITNWILLCALKLFLVNIKKLPYTSKLNRWKWKESIFKIAVCEFWSPFCINNVLVNVWLICISRNYRYSCYISAMVVIALRVSTSVISHGERIYHCCSAKGQTIKPSPRHHHNMHTSVPVCPHLRSFLLQ